jgi:uncharacterized membrane protein YheB (UPF0754 family)
MTPKQSYIKRRAKKTKKKTKKNEVEQRLKPYTMDHLRNKTKKQMRLNKQFFRSFEKQVIKPCNNDLQVELSNKLKKANSDRLISWERLKASLLASAQKVALFPTLLSFSETEVLLDRENGRVTLYKDGTAIKSYRLLVGDIFKMI